MAPKKAGKHKAAPKGKQPKKQKTEEEEVPPENEAQVEEGVEGEEEGGEDQPAAGGQEEAGEEAEAPAAQAKARAGKGGKGLPAVKITDLLLCDHRDTVALINHFQKVAWRRPPQPARSWDGGCLARHSLQASDPGAPPASATGGKDRQQAAHGEGALRALTRCVCAGRPAGAQLTPCRAPPPELSWWMPSRW